MIDTTAYPTDQAISVEGCQHLLTSTRVARIAFVDGDRPHLVVMNYLMDGADILLQTSEDTTLAARTSRQAIAAVLEVDSVSAAGKFGWSIIASGSVARDTSVAPEKLPVPWRTDAVGVGLRLTVDSLTGRQVAMTSATERGC